MLAEKKGKQKWCQDPRNSHWSRDKSKYGYRMLEQMGWKEGKGLGVREDGDTEHVKIHKKADNCGIGSKRDRDEGWLAHQDAFENILAGLNAVKRDESGPGPVILTCNKPAPAGKTLVDNATQCKKIVYKKVLHSKDLSVQSSEDLDCILGRKKRKRVVDKDSSTLVSHGVTTVTQSQSVQDYFSDKMKLLKKKRNKES